MSVLKVLRKVKNIRELYRCKYSNVRFQGTEVCVEEKQEITKARRFSKPLSELELKPYNVNFVAAIFGRSFDKEILEYPEIFTERDISTVIEHSTVVEKFLGDNPKIKLNVETLSELKPLELFGLSIPQKYGGAGYNRTEINFLLECMGIEFQVGRFVGCNEDYGCRLLSKYGNEEQKARYLPRLASGQSMMTLAYLESGSMIDFSNFQAYSITDSENNGYLLKANKKWVHNADVSDLILVLAKKTTVLMEEETSVVDFNMYIVDKNTPGVTVRKVLTENLEGFKFYEVDFNNVFVPAKNVLGSKDTCGVTILKSALSHGFLTDAAFCCSLIKQIVDEAYSFVHDNKVYEKLDKGYIMTQDNISSLTMYAYVLESVVYLLSGRFDLHEEHDLFDETVLGKIIAVEMLKCAIQKYIEITGCESFRISSLLDEALKAWHYYSVMDENLEYLKMMVGGSGLCYATLPLSDKVKKLRNVTDNFLFTIKEIFKREDAEQKLKKQFKLKMEVHSSLETSIDFLETSLTKFLTAIESNFIEHGRAAIDNEHIIIKFAEIAAYLYAVTACISRASSSVCYDFVKCELDVALTDKFAFIALHKIESLLSEEVEFLHLSVLYKEIGKITFQNKGYPAQHPLTRTY